MKLYLVLGGMAFMLLILFGSYQFGYKAGGNSTRALLEAQVNEKAKELEELKLKAIKARVNYQNVLVAQRRLANDRLNELLKINKDLEAWWNAPVHPCAVNYIFRVSESSCEGLDKLPSRANAKAGDS